MTLTGGAVAWSSKKQATVALSTAESKYIFAMHCAHRQTITLALITIYGIGNRITKDLNNFLGYCTISINSAVTCHKASGYGQNPSLVPGHRSSGWCQKTIGQKGQN